MRQIWNIGFDLPALFSFYTAWAGAVEKLLCRESWAEQGLVQRWHRGNGWKEWGCLVFKKQTWGIWKSVVEKERNDLFCIVEGVEGMDFLVQQGQFSSDISRLLWAEAAGWGWGISVPRGDRNIPQAWCVFPWLGLGQMTLQESPGTTVQDFVTPSLLRIMAGC